MAESVDALDLKSNRGYPSVPVQVWPRAVFKKLTAMWAFYVSSHCLFEPKALTKPDSGWVIIDYYAADVEFRTQFAGSRRQIRPPLRAVAIQVWPRAVFKSSQRCESFYIRRLIYGFREIL